MYICIYTYVIDYIDILNHIDIFGGVLLFLLYFVDTMGKQRMCVIYLTYLLYVGQTRLAIGSFDMFSRDLWQFCDGKNDGQGDHWGGGKPPDIPYPSWVDGELFV